jgi:8-oxo-dGTP pyrophosphatase MutT (NUDIX family)
MSDLAARLRSALQRKDTAELLQGDDVASSARASIGAAVLVAITDRPAPGVILTTRPADMRTHAGQVAFPGGRCDEGEDAVHAALREADEEIGLSPHLAEVLGTIPAYRTVTGFVVTPVVAVVPPDLQLVPHEREVADVFEAPLAFLLDPANHRARTALFAGRERHYHEILWNDRRIWGATAAMLINLSRCLEWH